MAPANASDENEVAPADRSDTGELERAVEPHPARSARRRPPRDVAASVLPIGVLSPRAVGVPASLVGAPSNRLLRALALPVTSLAMLAVSTATSLRAILPARPEAGSNRGAVERAAAAWWRRNGWRVVCVLTLVFVLRCSQPVEAMVVAMLVSMLALTSLLGQLAKAGASTRASVGHFTAGLLAATTVVMLLTARFGLGVEEERWRDPWVTFTLLTGSVACTTIASWRTSWSMPRRAVAIGLPLLLVSAVAVRLDAKVVALDRARLVEFVEGFDAPFEDVVAWQHFGIVAEWLRGTGPELLRLELAQRSVERALAEAGVEQNPLRASAPARALLGAARAGLIPERAWTSIHLDPEGRRILAQDGPIDESPMTEWLIRAAAASGVTGDERDRLATRLLASPPARFQDVGFQRRCFDVEMCTLLGRRSAVKPHAAAVRRELSGPYFCTRHMARGSIGAQLVWYSNWRLENYLAPVTSTLAAVRLMRQFGPAPRVDLDLVEQYLRRAATPSLVEALAPGCLERFRVESHRLVAEVGLRELHELRAERSIPATEKSTLRRVLEQPFRLGAIALVLLCLEATIRAAHSAARRLGPLARSGRPGVDP